MSMDGPMNGTDRRKLLLCLLQESELPLSGAYLGKKTGVSRQVVVQDIALLRTEGHSIAATARGYLLDRPKQKSRLLKMCHTAEQITEELTIIIDLGGSVLNVMVNHKLYGKVKAPLSIKSRRDISRFVQTLDKGRSTPLSALTCGYHFHEISAESEEILDEIEAALAEKQFLAELLPYENLDFPLKSFYNKSN